MSQIGARLREAREQMGLSLAEAEAATRIRVRFLEALENDQFSELPSDRHMLRGFVQNYASFLGLDPAPLIAELTPGETLVRLPLPSPNAAPRLLDEPLQASPLPLRRISFTLGALLLLGALAFWIWSQPQQRDNLLDRLGVAVPQQRSNPTITLAVGIASPQDSTVQPTPPQEDGLSLEDGSATPEAMIATAVPTATLPPRTPTPDLNATPVPTDTPQPPEQIVLSVQVLSDTWTRVRVDTQAEPVVEGVLLAGESYEWRGDEEVVLRVGNAAGLRVSLNGQDLGVLGTQGEVIERTWQRNPEGGQPILIEPQG